MRHVIRYETDRVLIDRQTLAWLTGRSVETIRKRCTVVIHREGKALYDMHACEHVLNQIGQRKRVAA